MTGEQQEEILKIKAFGGIACIVLLSIAGIVWYLVV